MFNLPQLSFTETKLRANNVTEGESSTHSVTNMTPRKMITDAYQNIVVSATNKLLSSSIIGAIFTFMFLVYILDI